MAAKTKSQQQAADIHARVTRVVSEQMGVPECDVKFASDTDDLGADSLDQVEMVMALEEEFDIELPDAVCENFTDVRSVLIYILSVVGRYSHEDTVALVAMLKDPKPKKPGKQSARSTPASRNALRDDKPFTRTVSHHNDDACFDDTDELPPRPKLINANDVAEWFGVPDAVDKFAKQFNTLFSSPMAAACSAKTEGRTSDTWFVALPFRLTDLSHIAEIVVLLTEANFKFVKVTEHLRSTTAGTYEIRSTVHFSLPQHGSTED